LDLLKTDKHHAGTVAYRGVDAHHKGGDAYREAAYL
jgi:hypothetical protein